jgi:hypothetical protein
MTTQNVSPDRTDLQNAIIKIAKLPISSTTDGYFTRQQLIELQIYLVRQNQIIEELRNAAEKSKT